MKYIICGILLHDICLMMYIMTFFMAAFNSSNKIQVIMTIHSISHIHVFSY